MEVGNDIHGSPDDKVLAAGYPVGTVRRASKREGRNIKECLQRRKFTPHEAVLRDCQWLPSRYSCGEGRRRSGRNGQVHRADPRRRGRDTLGQTRRQSWDGPVDQPWLA
jgi:hypothetical protein